MQRQQARAVRSDHSHSSEQTDDVERQGLLHEHGADGADETINRRKTRCCRLHWRGPNAMYRERPCVSLLSLLLLLLFLLILAAYIADQSIASDRWPHPPAEMSYDSPPSPPPGERSMPVAIQWSPVLVSIDGVDGPAPPAPPPPLPVPISVLLLSLSDSSPGSDSSRIAELSFLNKQLYCFRHRAEGYRLRFHRKAHVSWFRPKVWGKITMILHYLNEAENDDEQSAGGSVLPAPGSLYASPVPAAPPGGDEWLLFLDSDTVIMDLALSVSSLIAQAESIRQRQFPAATEPLNFISTRDFRRKLNAGVLLVRKCDWSRHLFRSLFAFTSWPFLFHWAQEQEALTAALLSLHALESGAWVQLPKSRFNAFPSEYREEKEEEEEGKEKGSFLIHNAGCDAPNHPLPCAESFMRRAWEPFVRRHNITIEQLQQQLD